MAISDEQEKRIEEGRDVSDMEQTAGWALVKGQLEQEIRENEESLKTIDVDRSPEVVGADYINRTRYIDGLKRVAGIVSDFRTRKEDAEQQS